MKLSSQLYKAARALGKASSNIRDIEVLASGNPEKIVKRHARKKVYGATNKLARKIARLFK